MKGRGQFLKNCESVTLNVVVSNRDHASRHEELIGSTVLVCGVRP